jgi:hypothetical protein
MRPNSSIRTIILIKNVPRIRLPMLAGNPDIPGGTTVYSFPKNSYTV